MCSRLEELRQKMIETSATNLDRAILKKQKEWQQHTIQKEEQLLADFAQERLQLEVGINFNWKLRHVVQFFTSYSHFAASFAIILDHNYSF